MKTHMKHLAKAVAVRHCVTYDEIVGESRVRSIFKPRAMFCHIAYEHLGKSTTQIGRFLGGRDHTTVIHARRRAKEFGIDPALVAEILIDAHNRWRKEHE